MFQYENAYYSILFNLMNYTFDKIEKGYSIEELIDRYEEKFSFPYLADVPYIEKAIYDSNFFLILYYDHFLDNVEDMVCEFYYEHTDTFYDELV